MFSQALQFRMSSFHPALATVMVTIYVLGGDLRYSKFQMLWSYSFCHGL